MARVVPLRESKVRVERRPEGLYVALPRRRQFLNYLTPLWIGFILVMGLVGMSTGDVPLEADTVLFLAVWSALLIGFLFLSLWGLLFHEEVLLGPDTFVCGRGIASLMRRRAFTRAGVEDPRLDPDRLSPFDPRYGLRLQGVGGGMIAFDYGDRTVRFGVMEEAEAKRVLSALREEGLGAG